MARLPGRSPAPRDRRVSGEPTDNVVQLAMAAADPGDIGHGVQAALGLRTEAVAPQTPEEILSSELAAVEKVAMAARGVADADNLTRRSTDG